MLNERADFFLLIHVVMYHNYPILNERADFFLLIHAVMYHN